MSIESCDSQRMKSEQDTLPGKYQNNQLLLFFINDSETEGTLFCCSISYILGFTEQITVRQLDFKYTSLYLPKHIKFHLNQKILLKNILTVKSILK